MPKRFRSFKRGRGTRFRKRKFGKRRFVRRRTVSRAIEMKWTSFSGIARPVATAAGMVGQCMNQLQKGTDRFNRTGNQITNKWLQMTFAITSGNVLIAQRVRIVIFIDKQANRATSTVGGQPFDLLFVDAGTPASFHYQPFNPNYVGKGKRIKMLMDRVVNANISGGANNIATVVYRKFNVKLKSRCFYTDTNNGNITDIETNALWVVMFSDQTVVADAPVVGTQGKFLFKDG